MNRLILIGNGFDLAHGLNTRYNDFLLWYLKNAFKKAFESGSYEDSLLNIGNNYVYTDLRIGGMGGVEDLVEYFYKNSFNDLLNASHFRIVGYGNDFRNPFTVKVKLRFAETLINSCNITNWVDIENEYYNELKSVLKYDNNIKRSALKDINEALKTIITHLETYLSQLPKPSRMPGYDEVFSGEIRVNDVIDIKLSKNEYPKDILALNFNYTPTTQLYYNIYNLDSKSITLKINHIHGKIGDKYNKLIFGFGDELDEDYQLMEKERINSYFEYIKSFWYLKTSHYKDILRFIDAEPYQVHIVGHSCGLSDRTMLHMIFEHENCKSIRIFYHENNERDNNYTELTHEIARHFKDKAVMRNKIVPLDRSTQMEQAR